ncbi:MAG: hypothetical protein ACFHVJ_12235 [Aestuariibacter sp.]
MAIPLLWIGAAAVATYAGVKYSDRLEHTKSTVKHFPGQTEIPVKPGNGAIVCCEVYGVLDHTGIWVDDYIIELSGSGLVRSISPQRFLQERSGRTVYVACGSEHTSFNSDATAERAAANIYTYRPYDILRNNCHHFVWEMLAQDGQRVGRFSQLNRQLANIHGETVSWHPISLF